MFAGKGKKSIKFGLLSKILAGLLAALVIILGVIPHILLAILEAYT